jgi:hypothetical protein
LKSWALAPSTNPNTTTNRTAVARIMVPSAALTAYLTIASPGTMG